jgi:transcriptional antiterminator NusG
MNAGDQDNPKDDEQLPGEELASHDADAESDDSPANELEADSPAPHDSGDDDSGDGDSPAGDSEDSIDESAEEPDQPKVDRNSAAARQSAIAQDDAPRMDWYILKVQSNRENSICDGLKRRVAVAGLDEYFGEILVPTEDVAEYKNGKRRVVKRKLYPGYIVVNMIINDETWFLVRETPGIGDFTGAAGSPTPMLAHEVERIVKAVRPDEESEEPIKTAIPFKVGDRVRIKEGTFENFEGDVEVIDEANGRVTVMINIFGRSTPVELEHWQVEAV